MKKFKSLIILLMVILSLSLLVGCNSTKKIDKMYDKLEKAESVTIEVKITSTLTGTISVITKVDGNKGHISATLLTPEMYTEEIDGKVYTYTKSGDKWVKDGGTIIEEENSQDVEGFKELLKGENYTYSKKDKAYILHEDLKIDWDDMAATNILLYIKKDSCKLVGEAINVGITMDMEIEFRNINSTKITLPVIPPID